MIGNEFASKIGESLAATIGFALALAFALGVIAGVAFPELWRVLIAAIHAWTA